MEKSWDAVRHEDRLSAGVPDVSYGINHINGWIELKSLNAWPKNPLTIVQIPGFTEQQRAWLQNRGQKGGWCWLLIRVERTYLIFSWQKVHLIGTLNKAQMRYTATHVWDSSINWAEFKKIISK
jgi:penicillin-binding protein-related factor A (putative recombinase)